MDTGKFVGLLVFALVGALVVMAFVPIIQDTTSATDTFENEGYYRMSEIGDSEVTLTWDHTSPKQIVVNGDIVSLSEVPTNKIVTIAVTDQTIIRYAPLTTNTLIQIYSSSGYYGAGVNDGTDMTITIEEGTLTADNGSGTTVTKTITSGYYVSNDGVWIMKTDGESAFIHKDDSVIVLAGNTSVGDVKIGVYANGTINDGLSFETFPVDGSTHVVTYGDVTFNYTDVTGYIDLVKLSNCQFDITCDDTTATVTYSYFLVPYEVTSEKTIHPDDTLSTVINLLPLIAVIGLFMFLVGEFLYTRYL